MIKSSTSTSATSLNPGEGPPVEQEARGAEAEVVIIRPLERDGAHHGLEAVRHSMAKLVVVAEVGTVRVQHELLQPEDLLAWQSWNMLPRR